MLLFFSSAAYSCLLGTVYKSERMIHLVRDKSFLDPNRELLINQTDKWKFDILLRNEKI